MSGNVYRLYDSGVLYGGYARALWMAAMSPNSSEHGLLTRDIVMSLATLARWSGVTRVTDYPVAFSGAVVTGEDLVLAENFLTGEGFADVEVSCASAGQVLVNCSWEWPNACKY